MPTYISKAFSEFLEENVRLDKTTGNLFWKKQSWKGIRNMNKPIGSTQSKNYLSFRVMFDGKSRLLLNHRVVFFLAQGYWPNVIDHIDGNGKNNHPDNLRDCSQAQNVGNSKSSRGSTSVYKGVYWNTEKRKWAAQMTQGKKSIKLGYFTCEKEAALAYNYKAKEYFGDFARFNQVF